MIRSVNYHRQTGLIVCISLLLAQHGVAQDATQSVAQSTLGISKVKPDHGPCVEIDGGKRGYMIPYVHSLERTKISFEMIPIPGGTAIVGSPESEAGRKTDEGPQYSVTLEPYWIAKTELTWAEYQTFMKTYNIFKTLAADGIRQVDATNQADAITVPTPLYEPSFTFEFGDAAKLPAVTMTQYAAKQYTKWLTGLSGVQYRLPTEAEWEHAARAGTSSAYSFGDDPSQIEEYAVCNQTNGAAKVGSKRPNAFGLLDMHGNVWEWVIDQYSATGSAERAGKSFVGLEGTTWPTQSSSRCSRGGGWQDPADRLRSAVRMGSVDQAWKKRDPNEPKSPWWYTEDPARMVGMRLVRSLKPLTGDDLKKFWEIDASAIQEDVDARMEEGRGAQGLAVPELLPSYQRKR
jgi:formylglycine-generating enzyme